MAEVKDLQGSQGLTWHPSTRLPQESREGRVEDDAVQRVEKYEFMRSVIGVYIDEETLEGLLSAAGGDTQLALDVFFAESSRAAQRVGGKKKKEKDAQAALDGLQEQGRNEFCGPRKPFDDLAILLGNGVDGELLAPIAAEYCGDIPAAVEAYFERADEHAQGAAERAARVAEYAENYYRRPAGRGEPVICNVYHLHWGKPVSKPREKEKNEKEQEDQKEKGRGTAQAHESAHTKEATSEQGGGAENEARGPEVGGVTGGRDLTGQANALANSDAKRANSGLPGVGLGIYHSGIEVFGREISFGHASGGQTGVFSVPPRCAGGVMPKATWKEAVVVGYMFRSAFEVDHLLASLARKFLGDRYDMVRCNCNHFASELSKALVGKAIPSYVNRTANVGRGILGVLALPSQAVKSLLSGMKKAHKATHASSAASKASNAALALAAEGAEYRDARLSPRPPAAATASTANTSSSTSKKPASPPSAPAACEQSAQTKNEMKRAYYMRGHARGGGGGFSGTERDTYSTYKSGRSTRDSDEIDEILF